MTEQTRTEPSIAPLQQGEERLLQTINRPDGNQNRIYLVHRRPSDEPVTGAGEPINFVAIIRYTDQDPTDTSPPWAWQRGPTERSVCISVAEALVNAPPPPGGLASLHPDVQWFADRIREANPGPSMMEGLIGRVQDYAAACTEVLAAANACIKEANDAVGAQNMAAQRPQHEISIRTFTNMAREHERAFVPLYEAFDDTCRRARELAGRLLESDPLRAEMVLAMQVEETTLGEVATAKAILRAPFGPTPAGFLQGVEAVNALIQDPSDDSGNIFQPASVEPSHEPAPEPAETSQCPWCGTTVAIAATACPACGQRVA